MRRPTSCGRPRVLLPDGGPSLGTNARRGPPAPVLETVLPAYGRLQLALADRVDDLLALGLDDMRPQCAGERSDEATEAVRRAVTADDVAAYERTLAMRSRFLEWAAELALSPVPVSLDHNDLYFDNVLVPAGQPGAAPRFYEWGDRVVAHPFATMLHGLGAVAAHLHADQDDPRIVLLRDAYLGALADYGSPQELTLTLELGCRVAMVAAHSAGRERSRWPTPRSASSARCSRTSSRSLAGPTSRTVDRSAVWRQVRSAKASSTARQVDPCEVLSARRSSGNAHGR